MSLSNTLWALIVLKEHQCGVRRPLALHALRLLLEKADAHELPDAVLYALFQVDLLLEAEAPEFRAKLPPVSRDVARVRAAWLHRARHAWLETVKAAQAAHPSMPLVKEVSKVLAGMGVAHGVCKLAEGGLFSVDILLDLPRAGKVALYIDGKHCPRGISAPAHASEGAGGALWPGPGGGARGLAPDALALAPARVARRRGPLCAQHAAAQRHDHPAEPPARGVRVARGVHPGHQQAAQPAPGGCGDPPEPCRASNAVKPENDSAAGCSYFSSCLDRSKAA